MLAVESVANMLKAHRSIGVTDITNGALRPVARGWGTTTLRVRIPSTVKVVHLADHLDLHSESRNLPTESNGQGPEVGLSEGFCFFSVANQEAIGSWIYPKLIR